MASIVDSKEESDVDSFFAGGTTGFLENDIEGLDDFEDVYKRQMLTLHLCHWKEVTAA